MEKQVQQVLKREIIRKVVDNREFVESDYFEKNVLTNYEIEALDNYMQDFDDVIEEGIVCDGEGEIVCLKITELLESLEYYFSELDEDGKKSYQYDVLKVIQRKLSAWKGFELTV